MISAAAQIVSKADVVIIIGTSLNVYPAAGLVGYAAPQTPIYLIDPNEVAYSGKNITVIREKATTGMEKLKDILLNQV